MIRRLTLSRADLAGLPEPASDATRPTQVVRLLAVSDEHDPALDHEINRRELGRLDAILGCGDLEPEYLAFLADAFKAPAVIVRGNHDRGANWEATRHHISAPLEAAVEQIAGIDVIGLPWPGRRGGRAARSELAAWWQAVVAYLRVARRRHRLRIVISHVPPRGHGDIASDPYHTGFAAYRWLCRRVGPLVWLHGHTPAAAGAHWRGRLGPTVLANVTGAVLVELGGAGATIVDK